MTNAKDNCFEVGNSSNQIHASSAENTKKNTMHIWTKFRAQINGFPLCLL